MQVFRKLLIICCVALAGVQTLPAQSEARQIVDRMSRAMDQVVTCSGRVKRLERIDGVMESGDLKFKVNSKPRKIYVYNITPDEGAELLYVDGWNGNKVFVHPNKFPWVNVSLSLNSDELLKKQHHNLMAVGFDYTNGIVKFLLQKYGPEFDEYVKYTGKEKWYGKMLDVIKITYKDYKFDNYTVLAGEDLFKIDAKLKVPAYKIIELNPGIDDFFDVKAGQVIKVPNVYAKEIVIMIDPAINLPVVQIIMDDKGLFEKYEYSELKINPRFTTTEFTEDFEAYGF
jgi:outer membrane lipoprotein-sorting protein